MTEPAGRFLLIEPLAHRDVAGGLRLSRQRYCQRYCNAEHKRSGGVRHFKGYSLISGLYTVKSITAVFQSLSLTSVTVAKEWLSFISDHTLTAL
jgi:hypothetical protein